MKLNNRLDSFTDWVYLRDPNKIKPSWCLQITIAIARCKSCTAFERPPSGLPLRVAVDPNLPRGLHQSQHARLISAVGHKDSSKSLRQTRGILCVRQRPWHEIAVVRIPLELSFIGAISMLCPFECIDLRWLYATPVPSADPCDASAVSGSMQRPLRLLLQIGTIVVHMTKSLFVTSTLREPEGWGRFRIDLRKAGSTNHGYIGCV
jgi:hypothetical protein